MFRSIANRDRMRLGGDLHLSIAKKNIMEGSLRSASTSAQVDHDVGLPWKRPRKIS